MGEAGPLDRPARADALVDPVLGHPGGEQAAIVAAPSFLPHRNSVPSTQMRWSTTLSLRAGATRARRSPRRRATSIAQRLSDEKRATRVSSTFAAS